MHAADLISAERLAFLNGGCYAASIKGVKRFTVKIGVCVCVYSDVSAASKNFLRICNASRPFRKKYFVVLCKLGVGHSFYYHLFEKK